jgi:predicted Zn finger-like uncharacterized protein
MTPHVEKRGTVGWVQCPQCDGWFHASNALLARRDAAMHCPHCHHEFTQPDAKRVVEGG